ncbi:MAG: long-chain fatty acid--CoA ligase [Candidatus Omnitrophica bacterium]|nr:long-chain fatty acid--CoA ligase [Candidatus Omnitrophota bacterium]
MPVDLRLSGIVNGTIPTLFLQQAARLDRKPLFWVKRSGRYEPITWGQSREIVQALSAFLLHCQVKVGERIVILSENRPEWGLADLAIQSVGAWTVPIYPSLTEREIVTILRDCEPALCVVSNPDQLRKIRAIRSQVPSLRLVISMDPLDGESPGEQLWDEATKQGRERQPALRQSFEERLNQLTPDQTATIIYTSGTTGEPKGVMLSHRNFLSNAAACLTAIPIDERDLHLSFLPLSHVFERMAGWYLMLMVGASVAYAENMDTIPQNMLEMRPTIMLGVPRFFEKLYTRIQEGLSHAPPLKRRVGQWALSIGQRASPYRLSARPLPFILALQTLVAERLVFHKLQQRLGGRLRCFVSGSAPLSKTIGEFFYSAGITILEGYGLTETSPVIAVNRLDRLRFGTVGPLLEGVEVRMADDGEILTKGPHVMQGYYRKPHATQDVLIDGWFHTGDIGMIDEEGFLSITDRKKDLIKTAGGKFVAPQKLENLFITDPYIAQALVVGDRQPYCVALIVPHRQQIIDYAQSHGLAASCYEELVSSPSIHEFVWKRVQALQHDLASFEQVKAIALLDHEFTQGSGELTPTLKSKRAIIATHYQERLQRLYRSDTPSPAWPN